MKIDLKFKTSEIRIKIVKKFSYYINNESFHKLLICINIRNANIKR